MKKNSFSFKNFLIIFFLSSFKINIKQLKDKIENIKTEIEEKSCDFESHKDQKSELRNDLQDLITNCEQLYNDYDSARIQVNISYFFFKKRYL